ncbi:MAG: ATP-binding protein [Kiritimatiellae bacterium]|nr:ATP-binding protein [Kiritimatiellia bacterium]
MTLTASVFNSPSAPGFILAAAIGAVTAALIYHFLRRTRARFAQLVSERDTKEKLIEEMRKLEKFRRDFISNLTHEIRTPLTGILGAVDLLEDGEGLSNSDRKAILAILKNESVRLDKLAQDILALARIEHTSDEAKRAFAVCNLADVLKNAFTLMKPKAATAGVGLVLLKNESVKAACDAALIEEALLNLIENALRYSGSRTIELSLEATGGRAKLSVADNGVGIDKKHLPRLFERFYRIDKARSREKGGTGLGLAIVKHIAQLHGGEVSVASSPGAGSTFSIII